MSRDTTEDVSRAGEFLKALNAAAEEATQPQSETAQSNSKKSEKPPLPGNCRNFTRRKMAAALPDIVDTFLTEARKGSVPHTSFLSDFGGFDRRPLVVPAKRRGKSLARRLLDEVEDFERKQLEHHRAEAAAAQAATTSAEP